MSKLRGCFFMILFFWCFVNFWITLYAWNSGWDMFKTSMFFLLGGILIVIIFSIDLWIRDIREKHKSVRCSRGYHRWVRIGYIYVEHVTPAEECGIRVKCKRCGAIGEKFHADLFDRVKIVERYWT